MWISKNFADFGRIRSVIRIQIGRLRMWNGSGSTTLEVKFHASVIVFLIYLLP